MIVKQSRPRFDRLTASDLGVYSLIIIAGFAVLYTYGVDLSSFEGARTFINESGEVSLGLVAIFFIYREYRTNQMDELEGRYRRSQTARYWVFYNARNRISQDARILNFLLQEQSSAADIRTRPTHFMKIMKGYTKTWGNDDILSRALDFEFVLLEDVEKDLILEYFEKYNSLEDKILVTLHMCEMHEEERKGAATDTAMTSEGLEFVANMSLEIRNDITAIIQTAMGLLLISAYCDGDPNFELARGVAKPPIRETVKLEALPASKNVPGLIRWPWKIDTYESRSSGLIWRYITPRKKKARQDVRAHHESVLRALVAAGELKDENFQELRAARRRRDRGYEAQ